VALICDTGPLFAALDRNDKHHKRCAHLLESADEAIVVPAPVVIELDWLAGARLDRFAFDAFLGDVETGAVRIEELQPSDYSRVRALCRQYGDLPLGFVDAAVVAVAERFKERRVASLDHRHFSVIRPAHTTALELLPA
jgi:predicted nucleic acid-binding protein